MKRRLENKEDMALLTYYKAFRTQVLMSLLHRGTHDAGSRKDKWEKKFRNIAIFDDYAMTDMNFRDLSKKYKISHDRCRQVFYNNLRISKHIIRRILEVD